MKNQDLKQDLGIGGWQEPWSVENEEAVEKAIRVVCGGHLPNKEDNTSTAKIITEKILERYSTGRSHNTVEKLVGDIIKKFKTRHDIKNIDNVSYTILKEYLRLDKESEESSFLKDRNRVSEINNDWYTHSGISLTMGDIPGIGSSVYFIRPTILDADYAEVFLRAFTCQCKKSAKKVESDKMPGSDKTALYHLPIEDNNSETMVSIPIGKLIESDNKADKMLLESVYILLDFLLARILSDIKTAKTNNSPKPYKQTNSSFAKCLTKLLDGLQSMFDYTYSKRDVLFKAIKDAHTSLKEAVNIKIIKLISERSKKGVALIPEYRINMPRVFELYVLSHITESYSDVKYKPNYEKMEPDITIIGKNLIVDAKYKFEYDEDPNYCQVDDAGRMAKYLIKMITENEMSKPIGVLLYPSYQNSNESIDERINTEIDKKSRSGNQHIIKVSVPLPPKEQSLI